VSETVKAQTIQEYEKERTARPRRRGLAGRLARAFVLLAGVLLLIVGLVLTFVSLNTQLEQFAIRQEKTASEAALLTSAYLTQARNTLRVYGQGSSIYALLFLSMDSQQEELRKIMLGDVEVYQELTLVSHSGKELAKVSRFRGYLPEDLVSQAGTPYFQQAVAGEVYVANRPTSSLEKPYPGIVMAVPVEGRIEEERGVLIADVSVKGMWNAVAQVEVGDTGYAYIVDRDTGQLIAHSEVSRYFELEGQSVAHVPLVRQIMAGETNPNPRYQGLAGENVIGAAAALPGTNWVMVVELPTSEALASMRQMLSLLAVLIVLGVVAAASLGLIIPRRIVQPLQVLQEGVEEIGSGNLERVIEVQTGDEIQDLAEAFNQMAANLRASQASLELWGHELEDRVEERTNELAQASQQMQRRADQLEASAEVARTIASLRDLDELLPRVTQLISDRFGWYHVGIFLLDQAGEYAVLRAANSEGGQRMLARMHRLQVGQVGIVGSVTGSGQPRIALDVDDERHRGEDAVYFDNPDLPNTRSEMALPLKVAGEVIGALDVQSTAEAAYDEEDVALLSILADQVAIAIENARLFAQTEEALEEVRALHRQYVEREWGRVSTEYRELAYEYLRGGAPPLDEPEPPEMAAALTEGELVAWSEPVTEPRGAKGGNGYGQRPARAALAAPIKFRDQVIGVVDLQETDKPRRWTEDEIALVQAISDQVGLALENARLFADTQRRAEQMSTLNRIGLDLASGLDLERVLETLYEHCKQVLPTDTFYVAIYNEESDLIEFPLLTGSGGPLELKPMDIQREPGLTGYVIRTGGLLYVPDTHNVPASAPYHAIPLNEMPNRSYLGVPLTVRGEVFGVLSIQGAEPNAYSNEDVELATTIGTQASIAVENARAYQRLVDTAERLAEVDRLKTQFLANMSHELRTPLNSIIGFSRVMLKGIDGPLTELQEADLSSIHNSGQHLLGLINSILDMSKIEAGKMDLSFDEVPLPEILDASVSVAKALVKDKPIELHAQIPDELPTVWADAQRVRQVILNLLSNAAKFTEGGHIVLRAEADPEFVTISVSDTGVGIELEAQERLFIPFQQVDGSTTRRAEGTGLGLAISRSFIELHGGEIWVESEPGHGSTFAFTLPVYQVAVEQPLEDSEFELEPGKKVVLAIDDDTGVITLLRRYLENDGYQVIGVTHSPQALEAAQRLASNLTAITLDVVMPNMDGWMVLQALKENAETEQIPVIMCSIVDDLDQGLTQGAAACLRKPITRDELLGALEKVAETVQRQ
jgi:signal transduction histidine kinase/HAMP domain-containing protein/ActR/RegA family two-component response regulator